MLRHVTLTVWFKAPAITSFLSKADRRKRILSAKIALDHALIWLLDRAVRLSTVPLLRTILGRWPRQNEIEGFRRAHKAGGHLPRVLHALAVTDAARRLITSTALDSWLPGGAEGSDVGLVLGRRPRAAFMHLEKTGGTSVEEYLREQYHLIQVVKHPPEGDIPAERLLHDDAARRCLLLWGHYDVPFFRAFDPERRIFTMLREPRARILSLYYYWRASRPSSEGGEPHPAAVDAARLGLLDFLRHRTEDMLLSVDNLYARRLTTTVFETVDERMAQAPEDIVAQSIEALDSLYAVGLTERMEDSLRLFAARFNLIPPIRVPRVNDMQENMRSMPQHYRPIVREEITPEIDAELRRLTRFDDVIYAAAKARFEADLAAAGLSGG